MKKKILCMVLGLCMALQLVPVSVFADTPLTEGQASAAASSQAGEPVSNGACSHVHDAACGYLAPTAEMPCDKTCTETGEDGAVLHSADCAYRPATPGALCTHQHDDACGYVAPDDSSSSPAESEPASDASSSASSEPASEASGEPEKTDSPFIIKSFVGYDLLGMLPYQELTVALGTAWDALTLPAEIECEIDGAESPVKVPANWVCIDDSFGGAEYDPEQDGAVYTLELVLPEGYRLGDALTAQIAEQGGFLPWISLSFESDNLALLRALPNEGSTSSVKYFTGLSNAAFNVQGGAGEKTTYGNGGYAGQLLVSGQSSALTGLQNGVPYTYSGIELTQTLSFDATGAYVKIQYNLRNVSGQTHQVSLVLHSDVQIDTLDRAPIENTDTGFKMWNTTKQFNVIAKNAYGVTNADTLWFGYYHDRYNFLYNTIEESLASGNQSAYTRDSQGNILGLASDANGNYPDSGMAISWRNRTIPAGETRTYSFLLGVGSTASAPILDVGSDITVTYGQQLNVTALVKDTAGSVDTLYYVLDMGTDEETSPASLGSVTANGEKLPISGDITLPAVWEPGELHKIYIWVMNQANAMSGIKEVPVYVKELESSGDIEMVPPVQRTLHFESGAADAAGTGPADQLAYVAEKVTLPECPYTRAGYAFGGWYAVQDEASRYPAYGQFTMPDADTTLVPYWIANETGNAAYFIEYYLQNLNDPTRYTKTNSVSREGDIGATVALQETDHLTFTGFTEATISDTVTSGTVVSSTVLPLRLKLYYNRNPYTLTFSEQYDAVTKPYGSAIVLSLPASPDPDKEYVWNTASDGTGKDYTTTYKLTGDATLYLFLKNKPTTYTVQHLLQNLDGTAYDTVYKTSTFANKRVGDVVTPPSLNDIPGFELADADPARALALDPAANSFTCRYNRRTYTATFDSQQATTPATPGSASAIYEKTVSLPSTPAKTGYSFGGWFTEPAGAGNKVTSDIMMTGDVTLYANWIANEISLPGTTAVTGTYGTPMTSVQLSAQNGTGSYTYAVTSGSLPQGVTLSAAGKLSGTPAETILTARRVQVQATDTDSGKTASGYLDFTVAQKSLSVANVQIKEKQYDGLTAAEYEGTPTLSGVVSGDTVVLQNGAASFSSAAVAQDVTVTFTDFTLSGEDAANYIVKQPDSVTANIVNTYNGKSDFTSTSTGWSNEDFVVTAKTGYLVSRSGTDAGPWTSSISVTTEAKDGELEFYLRNTATKAISTALFKAYNIDKTAPYEPEVQYNTLGWKQLLNQLTFGRFFKETVEVNAQAKDALSQVESYKFLASDTPVTDFENVTWRNSLTLIPNSKKYVYIKATDYAGNSIIGHEGTVVYTDSALVTEALAFTKTSATDLTATVTLNGNTVDQVYNGQTLLVKGTDYTASDGVITLRASYLNKLSAGKHTLTISYLPLDESYVNTEGNQAPAETTIILTVSKAAQAALSLGGINAAYTYGDAAFPVTVSGGSGTGKVTFSSSDEAVATVSAAGVVAITGAGSFTLTATKAADGTYLAQTATFDVAVGQAAAPALTVPTPGSVTYAPGKTLGDISLPAGWAWETGSTVPTVNNGGYAAYYTVPDDVNYDFSGVEGYDAATHQVKRTIPVTVLPALPGSTLIPTSPTVSAPVVYDPSGKLGDVGLPTGWVWQDETTVPTVQNSGYVACYAIPDDVNYDFSGVPGYNAQTHQLESTVSVTVSPALPGTLVPETPQITADVTYSVNGTLGDIDLPAGFSWGDETIVPTVQNSGYTAYYAIPDDVNYDFSQVPGYNAQTHQIAYTVPLSIDPAAVTDTDVSSVITAPYKNGVPQTAVSQTQYTGSITWSPAAASTFIGGTVYTATIQLTATENYSLDGLTASSFTFTGADSVTYDPTTQQLQIVFPGTDMRQATGLDITGLVQKNLYELGEAFDPTGLTMTTIYDDATTEVITALTPGYTVLPAKMEANTTEVQVLYKGVTATVSGLSVKEDLTRIVKSDAITGLTNGAPKTPAALGLPQTAQLLTSKGVKTVAVVWDLAGSGYDPEKLTQQSFAVVGGVALPDGMTNLQSASLTTQIEIQVLAATPVPLPEKNESNPQDTDEQILGIQKGQHVVKGRVLTISADSFIRVECTYIPVLWHTNPSGEFEKPTAGNTYSATVDTSAMQLGSHTFTITYREVKTATGIPTGNSAQTQIDYQLAAPTDPVIYTITTSAGAGGEFTSGQYVSVRPGETAGFGITPFAGYAIRDVKVDGVSVGAVDYYEFHNITGNHSITASFYKLGAEGAFTSKPGSGSSSQGGSSSAASEESFWQQTEQLILDAPRGSIVKVDATGCAFMPACVLQALFSKDVNLRVVRGSEPDLLINGINMYSHTKQDSYTLQELYDIYYDFELTGSTAPVDKDSADLRFNADSEEAPEKPDSTQPPKKQLPDTPADSQAATDIAPDSTSGNGGSRQGATFGILGGVGIGGLLLLLLLLFKRRKKNQK